MVRVSDVYLLSYCIFSVLVSFMYIFVHVPVAGRIAPASDRNRIGPLLTRSASVRGPARARGCYLGRRGSTFLCRT